MKKTLFITALSLMLGFGFTACNNVPITGTWVDPADENSVFGETGFTLQEDGTVIPINTGYVEYTNWEKDGDLLIFKGNYTGTNPHAFVDTMWIEALAEDSLVLKDSGNYSVTYQRKTDTITSQQ